MRTTTLTFILFVVLMGAILPPIIRYGRKQEALAVLGEAKTVEITFRLLSLDYYGKGTSIFSPQYASGMAEDTEAEVHEMSMTDGDILLLSWSDKEMRPLAFLYTEWPYTVRFEYDLEKQESSWQVYRSKEVLEFGK